MARTKTKKGGPRSKQRGATPFLIIIWGSGFIVSLLVGALIVGYMLLGLPNISSLRHYSPPMVTRVLDTNMRPLAYWYKERRWPVPLSRIPDSLIQAFLSAEDARFYEHPGIDFLGVLRAVLKNVEAGGIVQGASTITQQVTRSLLLTRERSWIRKLKEAILAWQIDAALTKDEILTIYLNQIYLGQGAYGVEAAARTYFAKHVDELNLPECAILAGLPKAPSRYNPIKDLKAAKRRQEYVLRRMVEEGYITQEEAEKARKQPILLKREHLTPPPGFEYFLAEAKRQLEMRYGKKRLVTDGLTIVTTLNSQWQARAVKSLNKGIKRLCKAHQDDKELPGHIQGALLAMEGGSGAVRAMVGGQDFHKSQFNLTTQARLQTGSAIKPIIYAAALKSGIVQPNSVLVDEPVTLQGSDPETPWEPENFDKTYMGPITVRTALTYSRNIISVKLAKMTGLRNIHELARQMGIKASLANNLSIALGSSGIPPIQMVQAYSTFLNLGLTVTPQFIQEVRDRHGNILETLEPITQRVLDPVTAFQIMYLLEGVVQNGTGRCAKKLGIPAAGKTGTTDEYRDAWFIGFSPEIITAVWVGRDDHKSLGKLETGGKVACPIWRNFMKITVTPGLTPNFPVPQGVAFVPVERRTGEIITPKSKKTGKIVWEALREDGLPALSPHSGWFSIPSWLRHLDDLLFNRKRSTPFEEYQ